MSHQYSDEELNYFNQHEQVYSVDSNISKFYVLRSDRKSFLSDLNT